MTPSAGEGAQGAHGENSCAPGLLARLAERSPSHAPRVLFDLDGTLIDNRPRSVAILRELSVRWRECWPEAAEVASSVEPPSIAFGIEQTLRGLGLDDPERLAEAKSYWQGRFFHDDLLHHDQPYPGAIEFVQACYQRGAVVSYITARDRENMLLGTVKSLYDLGFPFAEPRTELAMKRRPTDHDEAFKRSAARWPGAHVIAAFDNEPAHCNTFAELHPEAWVFHYRSLHSSGAPRLDGRVRSVDDWRSPELMA